LVTKKPKKTKPFVFHTTIVPYDWSIALHTEEKTHRDFLTSKGITVLPEHPDCAGWAVHYGHGTAVFLRQVTASILLHELVHAVTRCFHDRGVPLSEDATEVLAYTLEKLFDDCTHALNKRYKP
jgi:hypothetical protein